MYIAVDLKVFRIEPIRAMRFAFRREDFFDILALVSREDNYQDYVILYID